MTKHCAFLAVTAVFVVSTAGTGGAALGASRSAGASLALGDSSGEVLTIGTPVAMTVPATTNIFAAGRSSVGDMGGSLPEMQQLPSNAQSLSFFEVRGTWRTTSSWHGCENPPDGGSRQDFDSSCAYPTNISSHGGIAGYVDRSENGYRTPVVGVFLDSNEPNDGPTPPPLDFTGNHDFDSFSPKLNQVFFIGDGQAPCGQQRFVIPKGATRFAVGMADAYAYRGRPGWYNDNTGSISVEYSVAEHELACSPTVDVLEYLLNSLPTYPSVRPTMEDPRRDHGDMQQTIHDRAARTFRYLKNPYDGSRWEEYSYDDDRVRLVRDTTLPADQNRQETAYDVQDRTGDGIWIPRRWSQGEETSFSVLIQYFEHQGSKCPYSEMPMPWPDGRHFLRYVGPLDMGGDLGKQNVVVIDRYHSLDNKWSSRTAERFWFAKGYGFVRWEEWPDSKRDDDGTPRTDDGLLDRVEDSRFSSSDPSDLLENTRPEKQVIMNYFKQTPAPDYVPVDCR